MPDEAKKLHFLTQIDQVMHKLPADYVINQLSTSDTQIKTDQWICSGQVLCQVSWLIKKLIA